MKNLSKFLYRIANGKLLLSLLFIYALFPAYFLKNAEEKINQLAGKKVDIIDLSVGFNPQKTLQQVADYGDEARAYYAQTEMTTDVAYPIVYTSLFCIILTLLFHNKAYKPFKFINLLPFAAMFSDFLENFTIVTLLKSFPNPSEIVAFFCEIFKMAKWISLGFVIVFVFYGLIRLAFKMAQMKK
jgi:hypothetical protein